MRFRVHTYGPLGPPAPTSPPGVSICPSVRDGTTTTESTREISSTLHSVSTRQFPSGKDIELRSKQTSEARWIEHLDGVESGCCRNCSKSTTRQSPDHLPPDWRKYPTDRPRLVLWAQTPLSSRSTAVWASSQQALQMESAWPCNARLHATCYTPNHLRKAGVASEAMVLTRIRPPRIVQAVGLRDARRGSRCCPPHLASSLRNGRELVRIELLNSPAMGTLKVPHGVQRVLVI